MPALPPLAFGKQAAGLTQFAIIPLKAILKLMSKTTKTRSRGKSKAKSSPKLRRRLSLWSIPGLLVILAVAVAAYLISDKFGGANAAATYTVYMSANGSDKNDGLSTKTPVLTVDRVQKILKTAKPKSNVEVRIKKGVYRGQSVEWNFYVKGRTISFMPLDYKYGNSLKSIAGRPVFTGEGKPWFISARHGGEGGDTKLRFYYLAVTRYSNVGIKISGVLKKENGLIKARNKGANNNIFFGNAFYKMGSKYVKNQTYGAIDLVNSRHNSIRNNVFQDLVNTGDSLEQSHVHGVYLAHHSNRNTIERNRFVNISGYPVNVRNDSNNNVFKNNRFTGTRFAAFGEWFADTGGVRECASHGNKFHNNSLGRRNDGGQLGGARLVVGFNNNSYKGTHKDCDNSNQLRVRSYNNGKW